jgi:hypothetical protein
MNAANGTSGNSRNRLNAPLINHEMTGGRKPNIKIGFGLATALHSAQGQLQHCFPTGHPAFCCIV